MQNWFWKRLWARRKADNIMSEGSEDIIKGMRRRTKGENRRTKFKKIIDKKGRWKAFSECGTCDRETSKYEEKLQNPNLCEKFLCFADRAS